MFLPQIISILITIPRWCIKLSLVTGVSVGSYWIDNRVKKQPRRLKIRWKLWVMRKLNKLNIFTFFSKHLRVIVFTCFENRVNQYCREASISRTLFGILSPWELVFIFPSLYFRYLQFLNIFHCTQVYYKIPFRCYCWFISGFINLLSNSSFF